MQDVIFKYPLGMTRDTTIALPPGSTPLHVAEQDGVPHLWIRQAQPQEGGRTRDRTFRVVGTGHSFPIQSVYIGTLHAGPFVWHVIEPCGT